MASPPADNHPRGLRPRTSVLTVKNLLGILSMIDGGSGGRPPALLVSTRPREGHDERSEREPTSFVGGVFTLGEPPKLSSP